MKRRYKSPAEDELSENENEVGLSACVVDQAISQKLQTDKRPKRACRNDIEEEEEEKKGGPESIALWEVREGLLIGRLSFTDAFENSAKIAAFDLDWTLIKTCSGRTFASNAQDWQLWDEKVAPQLRSLIEKRYRIVVFTN